MVERVKRLKGQGVRLAGELPDEPLVVARERAVPRLRQEVAGVGLGLAADREPRVGRYAERASAVGRGDGGLEHLVRVEGGGRDRPEQHGSPVPVPLAELPPVEAVERVEPDRLSLLDGGGAAARGLGDVACGLGGAACGVGGAGILLMPPRLRPPVRWRECDAGRTGAGSVSARASVSSGPTPLS